MRDKVTSKQIMYAAAIFIIGTSLLTKPLYTFTKNDSWVSVVGGFLLALLVYLIYAVLASKFPGKSLVEMNDAIFGRITGKIVTVLQGFFFFTLTSFDTNVIITFIKAFVLPNTPMALIAFMFIIVCLWAARKGPVNIMRYSALFVYVSVIIILLNSLLLYKVIDLKNLLPAFDLPFSDYLVGTHSVAMVPFCDPFALLMFLPVMYRPKEFGKSALKGLCIGAGFLLCIVLRDISVLGVLTAVSSYPTLGAIRQIDAGDIFTRMDIIYISTLISLMFYKVTALFYASVTTVQRLIKFDSYGNLIYIFGALLLIYSLIVFRTGSEHMEWLVNGAAEFFQTFFLVILPLLTLIVAACRGFFRNTTTSAASES